MRWSRRSANCCGVSDDAGDGDRGADRLDPLYPGAARWHHRSTTRPLRPATHPPATPSTTAAPTVRAIPLDTGHRTGDRACQARHRLQFATSSQGGPSCHARYTGRRKPSSPAQPLPTAGRLQIAGMWSHEGGQPAAASGQGAQCPERRNKRMRGHGPRAVVARPLWVSSSVAFSPHRRGSDRARTRTPPRRRSRTR
jgi:hypothetical protein